MGIVVFIGVNDPPEKKLLEEVPMTLYFTFFWNRCKIPNLSPPDLDSDSIVSV